MTNPRDDLWRVHVTKRKPLPNGEPDVFYGTCHNDGIQSLFTVKLASGDVRYASVLDQITWIVIEANDPQQHLATLPGNLT